MEGWNGYCGDENNFCLCRETNSGRPAGNLPVTSARQMHYSRSYVTYLKLLNYINHLLRGEASSSSASQEIPSYFMESEASVPC